jgi:hypothetical protein
MLSRALRLGLIAALVSGVLTVLLPAPAGAAAVTAAVVHTRWISTWPVPSPDPSGITYDSTTGRLIISDAEVDEMPLYQGKNLFVSTLAGAQVAPGGTSLPWSKEPTGVGLRATDRTLFVSDDDQDRIFQVAPGADGVHGTGDDTIRSFSTAGIGNTDPEDVAVDLEVTNDGHLLVIDGVGKEVWDYGPGTDGLLGTPDDQVRHFDVRVHGALDPEGIAYHPGRGTIMVLDQDSRKIYELDRRPVLLNTISIAPANAVKAAGLAVAPASNGSGAWNLYVVDRGVDNNDDPTENDGRFYELSVSLPPVSGGVANAAPVVDAGPDTSGKPATSIALSGSVTDDGLPSGRLTVTWAKASGPGVVTFANRAAPSTTATFSVAGKYVLRLRGYDGALATTDTVTVVVSASAGSPNAAPIVNAGPDLTGRVSSPVTLQGSVTDDGLPSGQLTITWSKGSGPGKVTFAKAGAASTTATFAVAGKYVLRLRGYDGALATIDTVTVVVS